MAKTRLSWYWRKRKQNPGVTLVFAGQPINPCPICGALGCTVKGNKNKGFSALCPGCGAGTAQCSTPFNALRVYQATRA
jgi:hypothetical protein